MQLNERGAYSFDGDVPSKRVIPPAPMPSAAFFESLNKPQWVKDLGTVEPRSPFRQLSYHPATTDKLPPPTPPPGFREYVLMRHAHGPALNLHAAPSAAVQAQRRGAPQRARRSGGALPSLARAAQRVDVWIAQNPDQVSPPAPSPPPPRSGASRRAPFSPQAVDLLLQGCVLLALLAARRPAALPAALPRALWLLDVLRWAVAPALVRLVQHVGAPAA